MWGNEAHVFWSIGPLKISSMVTPATLTTGSYASEISLVYSIGALLRDVIKSGLIRVAFDGIDEDRYHHRHYLVSSIYLIYRGKREEEEPVSKHCLVENGVNYRKRCEKIN